MHIGKELHRFVKEKGVKVGWLASQINTSRRNMQDMFKREDLSTLTLIQLSKILKHDFLNDVRKESSLASVAESVFDYRKENELLRQQLELTEQLLESKQKELKQYVIKRKPHGQDA